MMSFETATGLFCALGIAWTGYTVGVILANWWADQWFAADGSAHHCESCGFPDFTGDECETCGDVVFPGARADCVGDALAFTGPGGVLASFGVALLCIS